MAQLVCTTTSFQISSSEIDRLSDQLVSTVQHREISKITALGASVQSNVELRAASLHSLKRLSTESTAGLPSPWDESLRGCGLG